MESSITYQTVRVLQRQLKAAYSRIAALNSEVDLYKKKYRDAIDNNEYKEKYRNLRDHQDEVLGYIQRREGRFGDMNDKELADEVTATLQRKAKLEDLMNKAYPEKTTPEVSGIDDTLKSDFEKLAFAKHFAWHLAGNLPL